METRAMAPESEQDAGRGLIYFADPMCSWCWGFSPVMQAVRERFADLPVRLIAGGLSPGVRTPLDERAKAGIREHWQQVAERAGAEFDYGFFERPSFVYDTEPACRAMVVVQTHAPQASVDFLRHLQAAFYQHNRDISDRAVLCELAGEFGFNPQTFARQFDSEHIRQETRNHFSVTRQMGVKGFPALFAVDARGRHVITSGYREREEVCEAIRQWLVTGSENE